MQHNFFDLPQTRCASPLSTGVNAHGLAEITGISCKSLRMLFKITLKVLGAEEICEIVRKQQMIHS